MPASSAEKRARQRANRLKSSTSSAQTPEILPLPTDSTPLLQTSPPPFDFSFFIQNASIIDVHEFLATVSATTDGRNLKLIWKRAFEEGRNHGLDEGMLKCSEDYARGLNTGSEKALTYFDMGREQGVEEGEKCGREAECQVWLSSGHGVGQCIPTSEPRSFASTALQTDPVIIPADSSDSNIQTAQLHTTVSTQTSTISCIDTSVQASEPPPSPCQPQKISTVPLDWSEDSESLPITPIPPSLRQPRDLSVLRSSSSSPFSSLQHRSKCFTHYSRRSHHRPSRYNFNSFNSPHYNSFKQFQPHFYTKTHSHLNWESDPRLSDLNRALKALGWIRAP